MSLDLQVDQLTYTRNAAGQYILTLSKVNPGFNGDATTYLDGSGAFSIPVGGTDQLPGTPVNSIQFNFPLGTFAGSSDLTWNNTSKTLSVGASTLEVITTALSTPSAPTVTNIGTPGITTYQYQIVAINEIGRTIGSATGQTTTGNAILDDINYNHLTWPAVVGVTEYEIYLKVDSGGLTHGLLATVAVSNYNHKGASGNFSDAPSSNTTSGIYGADNLRVAGHTSLGNVGLVDFSANNQIFQATLNINDNIASFPGSVYSQINSQLNLTDTSDHTSGYISALNYTMSIQDGAGSQFWNIGVTGFVWNQNNQAGKTINTLAGIYSLTEHDGSVIVTNLVGVFEQNTGYGGSSPTNIYGYWAQGNSGITGTNQYQFYSDDISSNATNPYYSWFDSLGVRRVKEDATFDSVGQAIEALYNPQFTKYTPGASNYERVVLGQWNGNVAEIGVEKGGTGVLRNLRLLGTVIELNSSPRFNGTNSTGAGTALLGAANCPAITVAAPYTWITVITSDGSTGYIPVWK